jgi:CheY-specific phosphatase CheX
MKVEFINPFVKAAIDVLRSEIGSEVERGKLRLETSA